MWQQDSTHCQRSVYCWPCSSYFLFRRKKLQQWKNCFLGKWEKTWIQRQWTGHPMKHENDQKICTHTCKRVQNLTFFLWTNMNRTTNQQLKTEKQYLKQIRCGRKQWEVQKVSRNLLRAWINIFLSNIMQSPSMSFTQATGAQKELQKRCTPDSIMTCQNCEFLETCCFSYSYLNCTSTFIYCRISRTIEDVKLANFWHSSWVLASETVPWIINFLRLGHLCRSSSTHWEKRSLITVHPTSSTTTLSRW